MQLVDESRERERPLRVRERASERETYCPAQLDACVHSGGLRALTGAQGEDRGPSTRQGAEDRREMYVKPLTLDGQRNACA